MIVANFRKHALFIAALVCLHVSVSVRAGRESSLFLGPEQQISFTPEFPSTIIANCDELLSVSERGKGLHIRSRKKLGHCTLQLKHRNQHSYLRVSVIPKSTAQAAEALIYLLDKNEWRHHLRLTVEGTTLRLEGEIPSGAFYRSLMKEISIFENVIDLTRVAPGLIAETEAAIRSALVDAGYESIRAVYHQRRWRLIGRHELNDPPLEPSEWARELFWAMAADYEKIYSGKPQLFVEMEFHEVRKARLSQLGVSWPDFVTFVMGALPSTATANALTWSAGTLGGSVQWALHASETNQMTRLLANPKMVCLSGESVQFSSGGSIPIENKTKYYADTDWKLHGLKVDVTPQWDKTEKKIKAKLKIAHAQPVARQASTIPELQESSLNTTFSSKHQEWLTLTGFTRSHEIENRKGLPVTRNIPWIRWMTGMKSDENNDSELVIRIRVSIYRSERADG